MTNNVIWISIHHCIEPKYYRKRENYFETRVSRQEKSKPCVTLEQIWLLRNISKFKTKEINVIAKAFVKKGKTYASGWNKYLQGIF